MPGPPFAFGAILVILALMVAIFIPNDSYTPGAKSPTRRTPPTPTEMFPKEAGMKHEYHEKILL